MRLAIRLGTLLAAPLALGVLHAAPVPKDTRTPAQIELGRLEGIWRVTSFRVGGVDLPRGGEELVLTVKGGEFAWANGRGHGGKIVRIDPTKNPKEVDYTFADGPDAGKVLKAIYKLDGDTFTDCFGAAGADRPTAFESTKENGLYVLTYTRVRAKN